MCFLTEMYVSYVHMKYMSKNVKQMLSGASDSYLKVSMILAEVCVYVCMYVSMYVCMYVRTYVRTYVRMYVCIYVCMYVCMNECMYVCMYVCMSVCMYGNMCVILSEVSKAHDSHFKLTLLLADVQTKLIHSESCLDSGTSVI